MSAMTLRFDDPDELAAIRRRAEADGESMQQVIHRAIRLYVAQSRLSFADIVNRSPLVTGSMNQVRTAFEAADRDWGAD